MRSTRLVLLAVVCLSAVPAQTSDGYVKIGSDRRELHFARAARIADDLDPSKQMIHLVLSEAEIPSEALFNGLRLFDIRRAGANQVVELNFHQDGNSTSVNWFLSGKEMEGTLSLNRSPNPFGYAISNNKIKGKIEDRGEGVAGSRPPYEISVAYSTSFEQEVAEPAPTAADAIAAGKSAAAKAYLELVGALRSGDRPKILSSFPAEMRTRMDTPDFPKMLEVIQSMMPKEIKLLKAVEKDGRAVLTMSGVLEGKPQKGEAELKLDGGKWLMVREGWEAK